MRVRKSSSGASVTSVQLEPHAYGIGGYDGRLAHADERVLVVDIGGLLILLASFEGLIVRETIAIVRQGLVRILEGLELSQEPSFA